MRSAVLETMFYRAVISAMVAVFVFVSVTTSHGQQRTSSVVIHDVTKASNGGERATASLRNEIKSALEREKPCVETMDDQNLRDAIEDERERALLEGADSNEALKQIGDRLGSSLVITVQASPGPGGTTVYSGKGLNTKTGQTVANRLGDEKSVAEGLVSDLGSYLEDNCKPHWIGTIRMIYSNDETKSTDDGGAAHAERRNVKRTTTQTSKMEVTITATLLDPKQAPAGVPLNTPIARVAHRTIFNFTKSSKTSGENRCREPGKNPYFKGFSEEYTETTRQVGRATDNMPVGILIDSDGEYTLTVAAPEGIIMGAIVTRASHGTCTDSNPTPDIDAKDFPNGKLLRTSFTAEGRTDPKNKNSLSGTNTLPDGKTKISWSLRLVKPKGK